MIYTFKIIIPYSKITYFLLSFIFFYLIHHIKKFTKLLKFHFNQCHFKLQTGCELVAISTDSPYTHLAWITTPRKQGGLGEMRMPVLSDKNQSISRMYGILDEEKGVSLKGLFIIDKNQLIRHITINEICLARSVNETLRILEACKFVDEFGVTCPAGPKERLNITNNGPNYFNI